MRLGGYYKRFIEGFSRIAHPITPLQKEGVKFEWIQDCERAVRQMKLLLTSAPILQIVYPNEKFIVCIDACKEGLEDTHAKWTCKML